MAVDIKVNGENRYGVNNLYAEKVSGGNQKFELPKVLQNKSVTITQNETVTYTADSGYDGLASLEVTTNVSGGGGNPEASIDGGDVNVISVVSVLKFNKSSTSLDFTGMDTSAFTSMYKMFDSCSYLTSLNVSNFNTSNVTNMRYMFNSCSSLTSLDLSSFNTSNVTDMRDMFDSCSSLTSLNIRNFDFTNVTNYTKMFQYMSAGCIITVGNQTAKDFLINNATTMKLVLTDIQNQIVIASN